MAYTNTWDETAPLDTSLASLIGQDIRNFKLDIRQRVASFSAGPVANLPSPESVWAGVIYFATDINQVFQYSGSGTNWNSITAGVGWDGLADAQVLLTINGNNTSDQLLVSTTITDGIPAGKGLNFACLFSNNSSVTLKPNVQDPAGNLVNLCSQGSVPANSSVLFDFDLQNAPGVSNAQYMIYRFAQATAGSSVYNVVQGGNITVPAGFNAAAPSFSVGLTCGTGTPIPVGQHVGISWIVKRI